MKKIVSSFALLLAFVIFAFPQNQPNFSGEWELDIQLSKLDARSRIESIRMLVTQTEKDIKVETHVKRQPGSDGQRGRFGGGFGMMGDTLYTYTLDGKETEITQETPMGSVPVSLKAKIEKGQLKLSQVRNLNTPMGAVSISVKETWKLSEDGKTLTVKREIDSPMGINSSEMVFVKKN
ncbi:MAG: hypothetical protein N2Z23_05335 [Pyrinomonadaceae bacterium]|nr:hypothetical protein [Pyrinomonadaceae bacterium]MCX7639847.1 hypothetical protein [Pyrinomonadaceae bacterium]MDW8304019.1 hypothetical protein [Acidobacteriota bacterium]